MERLEQEPLFLRDLTRRWIEGREARAELRGRSVAIERARLVTLEEMFGDQPPSALDRAALLDWQARIGHLAPATRRSYVGAVGRFLRWLEAEGLVDEDLTVHLVRVREPRRVPRALRSEDVSRVLEVAATARGRAVIAVMVQCGLRCVEVSRLDLDDYDPDAATLLVRGKAGHERTLPVPELAGEHLDAYIRQRGFRPGPLFLAVGSKGLPDGRLSAKWISKRAARVMAAAGVHRQAWDGRTAHALRHTAASDVLDRCHDVRTVQQMLGHSSLQSTEIYLRRADLARLREAMEGRSYSGRSPTVIRVGGDRLRGAPSAGALSPAAGSPTGQAGQALSELGESA